MLLYDFPAFKNKKYTAYDRFHINGLFDKVLPRKNQSERTDVVNDHLVI